MVKNIYKNRMEYVHKETKEKIIFLKWLEDEPNTANCLNKEKGFIQLTRQELDTNYLSVSGMKKAQAERRRGQMW